MWSMVSCVISSHDTLSVCVLILWPVGWLSSWIDGWEEGTDNAYCGLRLKGWQGSSFVPGDGWAWFDLMSRIALGASCGHQWIIEEEWVRKWGSVRSFTLTGCMEAISGITVAYHPTMDICNELAGPNSRQPSSSPLLLMLLLLLLLSQCSPNV